MKRMSLILAVAFVCAVLASYLVVTYVRKQEQLARAGKIEVQPVVVATNDIPVGTRITASVLGVRSWPRTGVPQGAASEPQAVVGRLVKGEIARDEPILDHRLFPSGLGDGPAPPGVMSVIVPPGKRAMTVGVNEVIGVSGFILPKNRVDVIATKTDKGMDKSTKTILQNIEVLAAGQRLEQKGEQSVQVPTVTMAVTPAEAEQLALSLNEGKIHIVLRSIMDSQNAHAAKNSHPSANKRVEKGSGPSTAARSLVETRAVAPSTSARSTERKGAKGLVVEVIRGDKRTLETYPAE